MKKLTVIACSAILFAACNSSSTTQTTTDTTTAAGPAPETPSGDTGWISLFDGTTLNGWHAFGQTGVGKWIADSGTIHLSSAAKADDGDLVSSDSFANFDLKLDWKISKAGNSGILFYVQDDKDKFEETYKTGPEMQVLDDERHDDRKLPSHRAGSLYDLIPATPGAVKPAEEWNSVEIISNNSKLDFFLNGVHVVNTTMWDDNWNKMVANSKFKQWPTFATFKSGHIALQDHGNDVWFKNVVIKKL